MVGSLQYCGQKYYIFTIIDHFSKYAEAVVVQDTRSSYLWEAFFTRWLAVWGCPTYLLSDNGSMFASTEFKQRCNEMGIQKVFSTPYHPQGNGIVEAFHHFWAELYP